ncbi:Uncharacterised protein [Mycobacteroides abscessus subsp. massiliense]|nr:Uncharacterised protein [Mycobacteroides abscessus subsp. massiliense]
MVPGSELSYWRGDLRICDRAQLVVDPPLKVGEVLVAGRQYFVVLQDCAEMVDVPAAGLVLVQAVVGEGSGAISEGA